MRREIRRYSNRKLYDLQESRYVSLDEIYSMVRNGDEVFVVDYSHISREDITGSILLRALVEQEERLGKALNTDALRSVIKNGDGTLTGFIAVYSDNKNRSNT